MFCTVHMALRRVHCTICALRGHPTRCMLCTMHLSHGSLHILHSAFVPDPLNTAHTWDLCIALRTLRTARRAFHIAPHTLQHAHYAPCLLHCAFCNDHSTHCIPGTFDCVHITVFTHVHFAYCIAHFHSAKVHSAPLYHVLSILCTSYIQGILRVLPPQLFFFWSTSIFCRILHGLHGPWALFEMVSFFTLLTQFQCQSGPFRRHFGVL